MLSNTVVTNSALQFDGQDLREINEIAEIKSCNSCVFFETRKRRDLYMWVGGTPTGPSAKFHVHNVHTMEELKMTGNSLIGSRPLLSFTSDFNEVPHLKLLKTMFIQVVQPNICYRYKKELTVLDFVFRRLVLPKTTQKANRSLIAP